MDVISTVRSRVCPSATPMIASIDGSRPPGKMYFWIQVYVLREASIRLLGIVMAWIATRPPGDTSRSRAWK